VAAFGPPVCRGESSGTWIITLKVRVPTWEVPDSSGTSHAIYSKLYMKIVAFDEIHNFVVQTFSFEFIFKLQV
jgi:hypothetical protein